MGLDVDPKLKLNTLKVFLKELFEKVNLKQKSAYNIKNMKFPSMQRGKGREDFKRQN